jgi:hypothetical protein
MMRIHGADPPQAGAAPLRRFALDARAPHLIIPVFLNLLGRWLKRGWFVEPPNGGIYRHVCVFGSGCVGLAAVWLWGWQSDFIYWFESNSVFALADVEIVMRILYGILYCIIVKNLLYDQK